MLSTYDRLSSLSYVNRLESLFYGLPKLQSGDLLNTYDRLSSLSRVNRLESLFYTLATSSNLKTTLDRPVSVGYFTN